MLENLSKIGILLIGVALLVIAGVVAHSYLTFLQRAFQQPSPFNAYCRYNAVIVHANQELKGIEVLDNRSRILCQFEKIPAGSEELCMVDGRGLYVVRAGDYKKVVECFEAKVIRFD